MPTQTETSVQGAVWDTKYVDSLPNSSFAFVSGDVRKLPYKDADGKVDLPHVRNALARLSQTQGIPDDEKAKIKTTLQNALKNAKAADDMVLRTTSAIQANASDSTALPDRVHLLRDGDFNTQKYGEIPVEAGDLYEMKFNFDRGVGMANEGETGIPIDYSHESNKNAAGWIRGLEVVQAEGNTELWGTNVEWSDSGKTALAGKEYKCLSSDFYPKAFGEWVDPESGVTAKNVIVGAALTNRPMFTGNKPVIASSESNEEGEGTLTVININASEIKKETSMNLDELRVKDLKDLEPAQAMHVALHASELSDDERKKFGLEAADKKTTTEKPKVVKAAEVTGTEGTVTVQAADLKAQNDKISALETAVKPLEEAVAASQKKEAETFVDEQIGQGKIVADQKDKWVERILADDTSKELLEKLPENKLLGKKQGSSTEASELSAKEEQLKKAKELMAAAPADQPLSIQAAMTKVAETDPELVKRVADENRALAGVTGAVA